MATNAAMVLAKDAGQKPRELADAIAAKLRADDSSTKVDVAGPGFINLTLKPAVWSDALARACSRRARITAAATSGRARRSMSNTSRPIRPGRCMSAMAAARCSATRSRTCWTSPATRSRANITSTMPARRSTCSRARLILRYREALGEDIGPIPDGLYPGDYLKPVGEALAAEYGRALLGKPESEWLPIVRAAHDRHDDGADPRRSRGAQRAARRVLLRALADRRATATQVAANDRRLARARGSSTRPAAAAQGRAGRGLGGPRADAVPLDRFRRRRRPAADEVGRQLHLFRLRHRLSQVEGRPRLRDHDRRVGRRPRRLRQAHAGGGQGGQRRHGRSRRQDRASSCGSCAAASR